MIHGEIDDQMIVGEATLVSGTSPTRATEMQLEAEIATRIQKAGIETDHETGRGTGLGTSTTMEHETEIEITIGETIGIVPSPLAKGHEIGTRIGIVALETAMIEGRGNEKDQIASMQTIAAIV